MKYITNCLTLVLFVFTLNCEMKPVDDFYGLSPEETGQLFAGLITNQSLVDNRQGTVIDPLARLEWSKCTHGQVYRQEFNDCLGASAGTIFNPNDPARAGAKQVAYCDSQTHACNSLSSPMVLQNFSVYVVNGFSELYAACESKGAGWRVPTPIEMQRLVIPGRAATLAFFPSTQEDDYWTAWSNFEDLPGETAFAISFDRQSYGTERKIIKTQRNFVRCVKSI
ncbi:DUF1566 domain-containing protein [Leptospira sp. 96542]|nr:DUF1566 domain-containing protein [Leptospira sp. 96542]